MKDNDENDENDDNGAVGIVETVGNAIYSAVHGTVAVARPIVSFV